MGAWIETIMTPEREVYSCVAPYVGAWIETYSTNETAAIVPSLPTWERGLKLPGYQTMNLRQVVAPYVGAWIETGFFLVAVAVVGLSLPTWERGLKLEIQVMSALIIALSLPTWERGLKLLSTMLF